MTLKKSERQRLSASSSLSKNVSQAEHTNSRSAGAVPLQPEILFQDNHLVVVNKPAGLLTQSDRTGDPDLLTLMKAWVKQACGKPGSVYLGLVHRLDRPVSGVLALARTSKAASRLSAQFRSGTPLKKYLALVEGRTPAGGTCQDFLFKDAEQTVHVVTEQHPGARAAELEWHHVAFYKGLSLLDITLKTGRGHQIRAQLASRGMIIAGDVRYGSRLKFDRKNLALHCYCLELEHPVGKARMRWSAVPPQSWQGLFEQEIKGLIQQASSSQLH